MEQFFGWSELLDYGLYLRGLSITLYAMFLFRASSSRLYGSHSPLDFIIYIIIGAILGEAVVNNIPLIPSMIVSALIIMVHRFLSYLSYKSHRIGRYIKGEKICVVKKGKYLEEGLSCCHLTTNDILQALRVQQNQTDIESVDEAWLERSGQISFILKEAHKTN